MLHPVMWMFFAVLLTFLLTRFVTRRIRSKEMAAAARAATEGPDVVDDSGGGLIGNISLGGVHIHHQVFGILLMAGTGIVVFAATPQGVGLNVAAVLFGAGISLAFDEFALWLHLDDVYWSAEGRQSVDAIFCVLMICGILIGGADFLTGAVGSDTWWSSVVGLVVLLLLAVLCMLKGKVMTGVVGIVFSPAAIVGACRLAKPNSWWARRRYRPKKLARAQRRFGPRYAARWNRVRDFFGGAPDPAIAPPVLPGTPVPADAGSPPA